MDNNLIRKVVNFEKYMVFKEASITTAITFLYPSTDRPRYLNLAHNNYIKDDLNSLLLDDKNYVIAEDWSDEAFVLADKHLKKSTKPLILESQSCLPYTRLEVVCRLGATVSS